MTDNDELVEWLAECQAVDAAVRRVLKIEEPLDTFDAAFVKTVYEKAIRPLHYFREGRNGGSKSTGAGAGATPNSSPTPPPGPAPGFSARPFVQSPGTTRVEVLKTKPANAQTMKVWKLRWDPDRKVWHGYVPDGALEDFKRYCAGVGLEVRA